MDDSKQGYQTYLCNSLNILNSDEWLVSILIVDEFVFLALFQLGLCWLKPLFEDLYYNFPHLENQQNSPIIFGFGV